MENNFKLKKEGFSEVKKNFLLIQIFILLPVLFFLFSKLTKGYTTNFGIFITTIIISIPVVFLVMRYSLKKKRKQYESFSLIINEDEIIRRQLNRKDISIHKEEIKSITKLSNKKINIHTDSIFKNISIPVQIEDKEKLELLLDEIPLCDVPQIENKRKLNSVDLNGKWEGILTLGKRYGKNIGKEIFYNANITQRENKITGITSDISGFGINPEPADIDGEIDEFKISFIKQYRIFHSMTITEKVKLDRTKKGAEIFFTGFFNDDTNSFEGGWSMSMTFKIFFIFPAKTKLTGVWTMKKQLSS